MMELDNIYNEDCLQGMRRMEAESVDLTVTSPPYDNLRTYNGYCFDFENIARELYRVTKQGGVIFVAYCMMDASILQFGFMKGNVQSLIDRGLLDPVTFRASSTPAELFELHRKEDIDALRSHFDVEQLHFVAADGYANHMRDTMAQMDDATFDIYLRYHFATCERPDMIGLSHHTLDIFRKN